MNKFIVPLLIGAVVLLVLGGLLVVKQNKAGVQPSQVTTVTPSDTNVQVSNQTPTPQVTTSPQVGGLDLSVSFPANNATVTTPTVVVRGKTKAKAQVAVNEAETVADATGNFSITVNLDEGDNTLFFVVNDDMGNVTEQSLTVTYDSGK